VAEIGKTVTFRDQKRVQILFYPLRYNPARGELVHSRKIRVRIDYEERLEPAFLAAEAEGPAVTSWTPPTQGTAYKILTEEAGIYRLTRDDLLNAGVDLDAMDLTEIRLYHLGQEVAISVDDAN
jgi:hypothetical protein